MSAPRAGGLSYFRVTSATVHRVERIAASDLKLILVFPNKAPRYFPDQIFSKNLPTFQLLYNDYILITLTLGYYP